MKFLHTSDWHVGRKIGGRSRAEEHREVLAEIAGVAASEEVDVILVAGDLFDMSSPSPEDEHIVFGSLLQLAEVAPVVMIAGNHDGARRMEALRPVMRLARIDAIGLPRRPGEGGVVTLEDLGLKIAALPFVRKSAVVRAAEIMELDPDQLQQDFEGRMRQLIDSLTDDMGTDTVNVFLSHLTAVGGTIGSERHVFDYAVPQQAFPGHLSYVALGHLHRQQRVPAGPPVWYSGSPLQLDFGEVDDVKGVLIVEAEPGKPAQVDQVPLRSGTRLVQTQGTLDQVLARSDELDGCYVKVILEEKGRAGLNEEVRAAIPGAVTVETRPVAAAERREPEHRVGLSPAEMFAAYLAARDVDDPAVLELFGEIEAEVMSE